MQSSRLACFSAWGVLNMEYRLNVSMSAPLTKAGLMTMGERMSQAIADNGPVAHTQGGPANGVGLEAREHDSPMEGQMRPKLPTDALSLAQRKNAQRRTQVSMIPLEPKELQRLEDACWAREDPEVLAHYLGEFVVPFQRKIVAHGMDAAKVLADAAEITGRSIEELPLVGVCDPLLDTPR